MSTIVCPKCGQEIEIDEALRSGMETKLQEEFHQELETKLREERERLSSQMKEEYELRVKDSVEAANEKQRTIIESLQTQLKTQQDSNDQMRSELAKMMEALSKEQEARKAADLEAKKKLMEEREQIIARSNAEAREAYELQLKERDEKIRQMTVSLDEAKKRAEQGSMQVQGEALEIELQEALESNFPFDSIEEVKKGVRGADIKQFVKTPVSDCGLILWESKNAAWSNQWIPKFKNDIREAGAMIGILVSVRIPESYGDFGLVESGVWVTKPQYALPLATAIREQLIAIDHANMNLKNKDAKMDIAFKYITGPEFSHRVQAIIENYQLLEDEINKERKAAEKRWAKQEKAIRSVIANTAGMYGDFQGIFGSDVADIPLLEGGDEED